jgi:hypothetical protein
MLTKMYYYAAASVHAKILSGAFDLAGPPRVYLLKRASASGALERMDLDTAAWRTAGTRIEAEGAAGRIAASLGEHECLVLVTTAREHVPGNGEDRAVVMIQVLSGTRRLAGLNPVVHGDIGAALTITAPMPDPWWGPAPPASAPGRRAVLPNRLGHSPANFDICH